jgi:hypothetical protein
MGVAGLDPAMLCAAGGATDGWVKPDYNFIGTFSATPIRHPD